MRSLLAACLLFTACAAIPPSQQEYHECGMQIGGDYTTRKPSGLLAKDLNRGVRMTLAAATFTSDPRLADADKNCERMKGYYIFTMPTESFPNPNAPQVPILGWTDCLAKKVVLGTPPPPEGWRDSSLVHELFHVMQNCQGTPPDGAAYYGRGHENWHRDNIFNAIDWAKRQP